MSYDHTTFSIIMWHMYYDHITCLNELKTCRMIVAGRRTSYGSRELCAVNDSNDFVCLKVNPEAMTILGYNAP